jgi:glycosyltransferase involved in cell wall biosynthesis
MRVVFLNRYFHPDHSPTSVLLSDLAFALRQKGLQVAVITSRLRYDDAALIPSRRETIQGVDVRRVWSSTLGRFGLLGRSLDYCSFYLAGAWHLWQLARRTDILVAKTDPPLLSVLTTLIARLSGARTVNWLQDIFPEVAEALEVGGTAGGVAFRVLRRIRNWSLHAASINVVVGARMAEHLSREKLGPEKIRIIPNWSDGTLIVPIAAAQNELRKNWTLNECFVVGYAGNLGRVHDIDTIIEAMTLLHESAMATPADDVARRIIFVFIGGGSQRAKLEEEVRRRQLTNLRLYPYQPRERLAEILGVADVHLVSLNPKLEGLVVPSKFYGIAAAGRLTLFIGAQDGEIARLIQETGCGFIVAPGDGQALADRIRQLATDAKLCASMGAQARSAFVAHWDKVHAIRRWEAVLKAALGLTSENELVRTEPVHRPN